MFCNRQTSRRRQASAVVGLSLSDPTVTIPSPTREGKQRGREGEMTRNLGERTHRRYLIRFSYFLSGEIHRRAPTSRRAPPFLPARPRPLRALSVARCCYLFDAAIKVVMHQREIEISRRSIDAINKIVAPTNKTELLSLIGKVNFIKRFISNLSGKIRAFSPLLKLKADQEFVWGKCNNCLG